jgi:thymidylate synthase
MAEKKVPELTKEEFVETLVSDKKFAQKHGELEHIYGELWRRWPAKDGRTVDQVAWVVRELKADPDAHNTLVNSWNPEYLYSMAKPKEAARYPICHNMYQVNIKKGRLSLHLYQRSADIFLGVPFNIASYALLAHILAQATGTKPGEFIHTFGDVHIYENHRAQAKEQLARKPRRFPTIKLEKTVKSIDDFRPEHVKLADYEPHPPIKAELSAVGGLRTKNWEKYLKKQAKKGPKEIKKS